MWVMIKGRGESQIPNLTLNHKLLEIKGQMKSNWGVSYTIEKIFLKAIKYFPFIFQIYLVWKRYERPKFWNNKSPNFGTPKFTWESQRKVTFRCSPHGKCCNPSLGLTTKARGCKVAGQEGDPGALHMLLGMQRVWGHEASHSQVNSHVRSWSPERTSEFSERDCRGQNSSPWGVFYIIEKLLNCRCLKWACIAHLDIWKTSYRQKKAGSQIDSLTPDH